MTPKNKAKELISFYDDEIDLYFSTEDDHRLDAAKQFALIAAHQVLRHIEVDKSPIRFQKCYTKEWWEEVLKEIEMYQYS